MPTLYYPGSGTASCRGAEERGDEMCAAVAYNVGYMRQPTDEQRVHRENVGDLIRRAREAKGLTQGGLGEALGVSRSTVVSYERGESSPGVDRLAAIEETLGLMPQSLAYPPPKSERVEVAADLELYLRPAHPPLSDPGEEREAQRLADQADRRSHDRRGSPGPSVPPVPDGKAE